MPRSKNADVEKITGMEQTSPLSNTVSSQKSLPSSHDPGWNDPPERALSSQNSSYGTSNKRLLNKRVAFPLSWQASSSSEKADPSPLSNMPPVSLSSPNMTTAPHKPLTTPIGSDTAAKSLESDFDKDLALTEATANLESVMADIGMEKNKAEEIQKRLDAMKSDWLKDKLNDTVQKGISDVSKALLKKDVEQADKIHINLITQHATVCRTWISAIRHIILELKKECKDDNISMSEQSQSSLLSMEGEEK